MGGKQTKMANNRLPPSPKNDNFPIQSNPKFQGSNNYSIRPNDQFQNSNNNNSNNSNFLNNNFSNHQNDQYQDNNSQFDQNNFQNGLRNGPYTNNNDQAFLKDNNFQFKNNMRPNQELQLQNNLNSPPPRYNSVNDLNQDYYQPDADNFIEQPPMYRERVINITDNPSQYELPRPKVLPLTPQEIIEYKRQGLHFPPYRNYDEDQYDINMINNQPMESEYEYYRNCEPQYSTLYRGNKSTNKKVRINDQADEENSYKITNTEANKIKILFEQNCGIDRRMNFNQFYRVYKQPIDLAEKAFQTLDRDNDGLISYNEFLLGYCMTKYPPYNYEEFHVPPTRYDILLPEVSKKELKNNEKCNVSKTFALPFGPLDDIDPLSEPIESLAASLKPFISTSKRY